MSKPGFLHRLNPGLRLPRYHAEHPLFLADRTACGRNRARVVDPDDVTCAVCRRVMRRYEMNTSRRQALRRKAYARALLVIRDAHRAEFEAAWEQAFLHLNENSESR